jgi:hypothetical protein
MTVVEEDLEERKPTSAQFEHCVNVWGEMRTQSTKERLDPSDPDAEYVDVYEGHLTKLFAGLGMATPYYTTVMQALKQMGCVEQIRRGGGNSPSRWVLVNPPEEEMFRNYEALKRGGKGKYAMLEQRTNDLAKRVSVLESAHERLASAHERLERAMEIVASAMQGGNP